MNIKKLNAHKELIRIMGEMYKSKNEEKTLEMQVQQYTIEEQYRALAEALDLNL